MVAPRSPIIIPARNPAALSRALDHLGRLPQINVAEITVAASGDPEGTEHTIRMGAASPG